jgi:Cohesin domain
MSYPPSQRNRGSESVLATSAAILLLMGILSRPAVAQNATTISLGAVSGLPKSEVLIPVLLTPFPSELKVGEIKASIGFDSQWVSFLRAEKGFLLDGVGAGFQADLKADAGKPGHSVVNLSVATKGDPRQGLREGLVLTLAFRIDEKAPAGTTVEVAISDASASDISDPPKAIRPVVGKNGSIEVLSPEQSPYIPCFFFTH